MKRPTWPPRSGREFVRSEKFGRLLVDLATALADAYPTMDFTDAVASVFTWFDRKLSSNRHFINRKRFPNVSSFRAYVRQMIWNAARQAERRRKRREEISALPIEQLVQPDVGLSIESRETLQAALSSLDEPYRTVFERCFFDEEEWSWVASVLGREEHEVHGIFVEAVDMLRAAVMQITKSESGLASE